MSVQDLKTVENICELIAQVICDKPTCVETGSTYYIPTDPAIMAHGTTYNIAIKKVGHKGGKFYSLDINDRAAIVEELTQKTNTEFVLGDSVASLTKLSKDLDKIDLACFDSMEGNPDHMINEYNAIKTKLDSRHFILIDDIHNGGSVKYKKLVPVLKDQGYSHFEVSTPTGMFVAYKGYTL